MFAPLSVCGEAGEVDGGSDSAQLLQLLSVDAKDGQPARLVRQANLNRQVEPAQATGPLSIISVDANSSVLAMFVSLEKHLKAAATKTRWKTADFRVDEGYTREGRPMKDMHQVKKKWQTLFN